MNKLSLVGMQLPEKYKENFDISSEGPSSDSLYFSGSCIPTNESLFIVGYLPFAMFRNDIIL